ncbi:MAG TPA: trypsin-like peptidase domain-containing protein [Myxococcota bacterium]|jgi:serine protease Do
MLLFAALALAVAVVAAPPAELTPAQQKRVTPIVEVVRSEADGVVAIAATHVVTQSVSMFDVFAQPREVQRSSIGSGTVIHASGYVLTNAHVVAMASEISVMLKGGKELPAHVVAALPDEDIAIVKCDVPPGITLHAVKLGSSDDVMVGETVIAIGAPVGLVHTVTSGIISAVDRELRPSEGVRFKGILQTDAAINPGNSGGPLFNIVGEQIGVNTAIRGDAQNVGFAIPSDRVKVLLPRLLSVEARGRARLGVRLGKESDDRPGVVVDEIEHASPADKSGLGRGMIVTDVGDAHTPTLVDALVALLEQPSGKPFAVHAVLPEGTTDVFTMQIEELPPPDAHSLAKKVLGLDVADLDAVTATRLGLRAGAGVLVKDVERGRDAARLGVQPGDLITRVGPYGIRHVTDLAILEDAAGTDIPVRVVRIGKGRVLQTEVLLGH